MSRLSRPNPHQLNKSDLQKLYAAKLKEWGIDAPKSWKLLTVSEALKCPDINQDVVRASQGCVYIPYRDRHGNAVTYESNKPFYSLRFMGKLPQMMSNGKLKDVRYLQPGDSGVHLYYPASYSDSGPLIITEGPSKTEAGAKHGYNTVGLISVTCQDTAELDEHHGNPEVATKTATKRAVTARPLPAPPEPPRFANSMGPSDATWHWDRYWKALKEYNEATTKEKQQ